MEYLKKLTGNGTDLSEEVIKSFFDHYRDQPYVNPQERMRLLLDQRKYCEALEDSELIYIEEEKQ